MIVLYNPVSSASRKPVLPLAVLALAARMSWRVVIVDGNIERHPVGRIASLVAGHGDGPVILGVTVMPGPQLQDALRVCRELRAREVPLTIVWGGYFPTQHWSCCVSDVCVDYVIRGHGDEAFPQLVEHLLQGKGDLSAIEGLAWSDENGGALNPGVAKARDAGETAVWPFELVDVAKYIRPTFLGSRTLGYHSSFGCPFVCNFCAVVNMDQGRWLAQPAAYVAQVAELYVRDFGVNAIEFYDNNFFVSEERVEEVSKRIQGLDIGWWGEARVDRLLRYSDSTWQGMRDSGLKMVFMGAESGNAETLKRMDKGGTLRPEMTLELVERMRKFDVVPELSFVVGTPPDPKGDIDGTIQFIRRIKKLNPATEVVMYVYTPEPLKGAMLEGATASGFTFPDTLDDWATHGWERFAQRRSALPWLTPRLRRRLKGFERVLHAYYPTSTDVRLSPGRRLLLRASSAWRYRLQVYDWPLELQALQRVIQYQRPETSGF